ncbi:MAG: serine acetyltransferase [Bacteroidetes bacterium]|nr:serine acetyltransferase [Bacteroidota bacterium]MBS1758142.1 serine acetyltransferase [Bacteroidota bacterium]
MTEQDFIQQIFRRNANSFVLFPDKETAECFMEDLFSLLFTSHEGKYTDVKKLANQYNELKNTFSALLFELKRDEKEVRENTEMFFSKLPAIYELLLLDAEAVLKFDPAAQSIEEVLVAYPGFYATAVYRISHQLYKQNIKILPRLLSEYAHSKTGIDIHPGAEVGQSFFIDHGTGIVIGETSVIGNNVKIYQGVTLGALNVSKVQACKRRHPVIEDNVVIYSGATILGGDTVIGHSSIIGGNVWLTNSVPSHSIVYHKSVIKIRDKNPLPEEFNFVI